MLSHCSVDGVSHIFSFIFSFSFWCFHLFEWDVEFDLVVTVCGDADRACPAFPGNTRVVHVGFDDPPRLARQLEQHGEVDEESTLEPYRRVRAEIRRFIESLPGDLL